MMILSLVAMTGLEKCCITSAYLQWLFHSGERAVARGDLVVTCNLRTCLPTKDSDQPLRPCSLINAFAGHLTLKAPRKTASENVVCLCRLLNILANFSNLFLHTGKQCGPRSDCSYRSSLIWVHTVCKK